MTKMKVVQCWDDAPLTDLRLVKILRKYQAKATFNISVGLLADVRGQMRWAQNPAEWQNSYLGFICGKVALADIAETYRGFDVASHCWMHECAGKIPDEAFVKSAVAVKKYLEKIFQKECNGFAWPYGVWTPTLCRLLSLAGFIYGRTTQNTSNINDCPDPMALKPQCHFLHPDFYQLYENAKKTGIFYFWGHSYETLNLEPHWEQLEQKIHCIAEDPEAEWANVADIVPLLRDPEQLTNKESGR